MDDNINVSIKASADDKSLSANIEGDQEAIKRFFSGIVPDFVKDGVGIISDNVKLWRFSNQINIIKKAQKMIEDSGIPKRKIPLKVLTPIIEHSSLEEDPVMQEKWANMLANAATGKQEVSPNYAAILNELSSIEVFVVDKIFNEASQENDYKTRKLIQFSKIQMQEMLNISEEKADLLIENLFRLNLLQPPGAKGGSMGNFPLALRTNDIFEFTTLGYQFAKACKWGSE